LAATYRKHKLKVFRCAAERDGSGQLTGKYEVIVEDFQMTSGRMDTNLTDTVCLVGALLSVMPDIPYLLLACGDDGFLMLRKQDAAIVDLIKAFCIDLGLKPTGSVSGKRSDWEFCSKLFWRALDEMGNPITVLGAKPFRGIARMGVNTTIPGAANAAAAALSVRISSGHVPFLGPFADRTKDLCVQKKIRAVGRVEWSSIVSDRRYDPCPLNYIMTQERYNLGKENEDEFKRLLADLNAVPIVVSYEPALTAVRVDEA
jgi:hypothetical protein